MRKSDRNKKHSIKWATYARDKIVSKKNTNAAFVPIIYKMCGWSEDNGYTITGYVKENNNEKVLLFYMNEPEILKWIDGKRVVTYPKEWKDEFGDYYNIHKAKEISVFTDETDWKLYIEGVVAVEPEFMMLPDKEIFEKIEEIIKEINIERGVDNG